ncbi:MULTISPECIES: hypothetical protein [unclassified Natrinema]|uniref:hypothetical protein n=1 Tax=unclassified Natrinema TaxID=2622230 RepID=UPI00026D4485|nr:MULTISPECIES: hypothetical protein [unclassified Natrinema]AFO58284.1 hypothetical protein NJ7G_3063 [Natrinema sp. J7-2]
MKTLEVTDEQYAFIQYLREEISESVVGKYGFVREQDAVQFLVDNLDEEIEIDADEFDSSATDDVSASVGAAIDGRDDPTELEEVSYVEGDAADPPADDAGDADGSSETGPTDDADGTGTDSDDGEADPDADDGDDGDDEDTSDNGGDGSADDDDMLDEMMSLLETHDDKWAESDAADFRYTVDLPDGSSEQVQTKDDVRALLFKNYR